MCIVEAEEQKGHGERGSLFNANSCCGHQKAVVAEETVVKGIRHKERAFSESCLESRGIFLMASIARAREF